MDKMKKMFLKLPVLSIIAVFFCANICTAFYEPVVGASLDKDSAYVGDIIKFHVDAELPEKAYLAVNKDIIFDNFDTVKVSAEHISEKPNIYRITFELTAYKTGMLNIESVGISYINSSGAKRMFFTPTAAVNINSILGSGAKDIKDIKPLKKRNMRPVHIAVSALLIIVIIILFILIIKDISQRSRGKHIELDPRDEALKQLDELRESGIIKNGEPRAFYYAAAGILRAYISKKYDFNAMEMTSTELTEKLEEFPEIIMTRKGMRQYLSIFDLARYAGFKASQEEMLESLEKTKEFVKKL